MFELSLIGSMPREESLLRILRKHRNKTISDEEFNSIIEAETKKVVNLQERNNVDYITSGELHRDNYVSFISEALDGVKQMSMSELLDYVEDKKAFEQILDTLDVPAIAIKNAICVGKVSRNKSLVGDELKLIKSLTNKKTKITLPGPYLVTRSMWMHELSQNGYNSKEELGEDIIKLMIDEIKEIQEIGVDIIQFDEPVLTEVVFTEGKPRTFMCAALSERKDPTEELEFATYLIKSVMDKIDRTKSKVALHVCRGNWSRDESILLSGPYTPLIKLFEEINSDILFLEYSTDRAGDLKSLFQSEILREKTILGLGVINPRTDEIEQIEKIISKVNEALKFIPANRIMLNPDCGFATFANRPMNSYEIIEEKMKSLDEARNILCQNWKE